MLKSRMLFLFIVAFGAFGAAQADVSEYWNDPSAWISDVGEHNFIDFIGYPVGTIITDHYAHMGVTFTNFVFIHNAGGYSDGFGLFGGNGVRFEFDTPQHACAVDHLGSVVFALYSNEILVGSSSIFVYPGTGPRFSGIVSEHPFDEVYLYVPQPPFSSNVISIDNLYWGAPQGDLNGDGVVNVLDLLILLGQWGTCDDDAPCSADLDNNGVVNVLDLIILLGNWG